MNIKKPLLVGAGAALIGLTSVTSVGLVSAATSSTTATSSSAATDTNPESSLVDKLVAKFGLQKADVQAVFDEQHAEREAEMKANQAQRLADAVKDGDITQAQADHITKVRAEIDALRGDAKPSELSDETRDAIRDKMDELRDWADENNVDMHDVMGGHGRGMGGGPGPRGDM